MPRYEEGPSAVMDATRFTRAAAPPPTVESYEPPEELHEVVKLLDHALRCEFQARMNGASAAVIGDMQERARMVSEGGPEISKTPHPPQSGEGREYYIPDAYSNLMQDVSASVQREYSQRMVAHAQAIMTDIVQRSETFTSVDSE